MDINGCDVEGLVFVEFDVNWNIYILGVFLFNGDGINDEFWVFFCIGVMAI